VIDATEQQIQAAAKDTIPSVTPLFFSFRVMVGCGVLMLVIFALSFYYNARRIITQKRWLLRAALYGIPLPWIAIETGWFVAEFGRQPWAISEVLPTFLATSNLSASDVLTSMIGFIIFYTILAVIEFWLMFKFARLGPSSLHTGRYHFEKQSSTPVGMHSQI
jgi:cytochrome d ubiquinol oxidase subunit I